MIHEMKVPPSYFNASVQRDRRRCVLTGKFDEGDFIKVLEWDLDNKGATGRSTLYRVDICNKVSKKYVANDFCQLCLSKVTSMIPTPADLISMESNPRPLTNDEREMISIKLTEAARARRRRIYLDKDTPTKELEDLGYKVHFERDTTGEFLVVEW